MQLSVKHTNLEFRFIHFFVVPGIEPGASHVLGKNSTTIPLAPLKLILYMYIQIA
jgi:hypothetical protein